MFERDLMIAGFDPVRVMLSARLRADGRVVGYVDVLDAHPDDGVPWLGAVEIAAADQGRGYGGQCVEAVSRRASEVLEAKVLRAAVDDDDDRARRFLKHFGFRPVAEGTRSSPVGRVPITVLERPLASFSGC